MEAGITMEEETASANVSPEEAVVIRPEIFPTNGPFMIESTSMTNEVPLLTDTEGEGSFSHIRETVDAARRLLR
jgi:hypothetical protein